MIQYTIGEIIKRERKAQKISQEKLSEGICTPSWLSKIETGACIPTVATFELLMQRLGKSASQYVYYKSDTEIEVEHLKFKVRRTFAVKAFDESEEYFIKLKQLARKDYKLDQQFILLYEALFRREKEDIELEEFLDILYRAIEYSIKDFSLDLIHTYLLNEEDIVIINNLAITLRGLGKKNEAMNVLLALKVYLEDEKYDYKEKARTYPLILYNLSTWQGLEGSFTECLLNCDRGIEFCIRSNVLSILPYLLFNKACALIELGDLKVAEQYMKQAYYMLVTVKEEDLAQIVIDYGIQKLGKDITV